MIEKKKKTHVLHTTNEMRDRRGTLLFVLCSYSLERRPKRSAVDSAVWLVTIRCTEPTHVKQKTKEKTLSFVVCTYVVWSCSRRIKRATEFQKRTSISLGHQTVIGLTVLPVTDAGSRNNGDWWWSISSCIDDERIWASNPYIRRHEKYTPWIERQRKRGGVCMCVIDSLWYTSQSFLGPFAQEWTRRCCMLSRHGHVANREVTFLIRCIAR